MEPEASTGDVLTACKRRWTVVIELCPREALVYHAVLEKCNRAIERPTATDRGGQDWVWRKMCELNKYELWGVKEKGQKNMGNRFCEFKRMLQ